MSISRQLNTAVTDYAQSDKIKSALIWTTSLVSAYQGQSPVDQRGMAAAIDALLEMIAYEVRLSQRYAPRTSWKQVEKHLDLALVMVKSGVVAEAHFHLGKAISHVTDIARRAILVLRENGIPITGSTAD